MSTHRVEGGGPIVAAAGLTKVFRDFWMRTRAKAVDRIDFEIEPGQIFGLLGPNGSGKSTTIKMILGLLKPTGGRLSVFDRPPSDVAVKRHIGFLPEESYLYRYLTPIETLDYYGRLFGLGRSERQRRGHELLEMLGLSGVAHRAVGEFSKGMMRRIGLAQALVNDPDLLILDEPTSGLDPIGTAQVKQLLMDLRGRGKTILLSSHLLGDVQDVCDTMVMLYGGRIRAQGTVEELLEDADHTVFRTPRLTPELVQRIERVLQDAGAGIESVESPKQRLEDLFMDIVEEARREHVETSGATEGGDTADFLKSGAVEGEALLDALQSSRETPARAAVRAEEPADDQPRTSSVVDTLVQDEVVEKKAAPPPPTPSNVDDSLIDQLMSGDDQSDQDNAT